MWLHEALRGRLDAYGEAGLTQSGLLRDLRHMSIQPVVKVRLGSGLLLVNGLAVWKRREMGFLLHRTGLV